MMLHPEIQRRAHEELDRVVGPDRLPTLQDRDNLPFIDAIVKETFRWHPIVPMGVPHVVTEDDTFDGYLIPEGAMILPNVWWFTHDPSVYPDPMTFNPDRWLVENPPADSRSFIFGFGRRICPGKLLADQSVFLTIACSLAVFDIANPVDPSTGKEIEPVVEFTGGGLSHLASEYKVAITPRTAEYASMVKSVEVDHPWEEGSAKLMAEMGLQTDILA
jgi:cytochrome P450